MDVPQHRSTDITAGAEAKSMVNSEIPGKRATIHDVARAANVSPATVSLVVHDKGQLSKPTRERVMEAIDAVGYEPRRIEGRPRRRRQSMYCLVVDDIRNPYFHELYKGITDALDPAEAIVTIASTEDQIERQTLVLDNLAQSSVDGVIVVPASGAQPEDLEKLANTDIPHLLVVRNIGHGALDYIGGNPMLGTVMAAEHLIALGHRRIAFVGGYVNNFAFHERYVGFISTMMKHNIPVEDGFIVNGGSTKAFGREAASRLLNGPDRPTAFLGYNDLVAIGIMNAISDMGLMVGKDIAVVGYDDIPEAADQPVALTTIATPAYQLGKIVANSLSRMSMEAGRSPINITFPPTLVKRESCGATRYWKDGNDR
ncbi:substrate-binding domain-containing protein [Bradyrhizobium sp. LMTR 3]|uniref:substrate-binding domain-containing protein n=1 Tax=Bradyrhizobium sp. LMTR 3 TaxID=189873 RepID=UPI000810D35E|nr:substrate-binding domain-containing protein [Bradyrhizobium sp. LMTR 3]OCK59891.1 hypothetical protein LMTR3_19955 [Bradyrhizobium sp. LMTR 3]